MFLFVVSVATFNWLVSSLPYGQWICTLENVLGSILRVALNPNTEAFERSFNELQTV